MRMGIVITIALFVVGLWSFLMGRILLGCEESDRVRSEFEKLGHDAWSCDLVPSRNLNNKKHIQDDILNHLDDGWDMAIFFPPCTYLTVSANKWYKDQPKRKSGALVGGERRAARREAIIFFMKLANCKIPKIGIENPIGIMSTFWRKPDQIIQPWMFGHGETKATCLWLRNLPLLVPTDVVEGREQRIWKMSPSKDRTMFRSTTFPGVSKAMSHQWGSLIPA